MTTEKMTLYVGGRSRGYLGGGILDTNRSGSDSTLATGEGFIGGYQEKYVAIGYLYGPSGE